MPDLDCPAYFTAEMRAHATQLRREVEAARGGPALMSDDMLIMSATQQHFAAQAAFELAAFAADLGDDKESLETFKRASALVRDCRTSLAALCLVGERRGLLSKRRVAEAAAASSDYALTNRDKKGQTNWDDLLQ